MDVPYCNNMDITPPDMTCWTQLGHFWWIFNPFRLPILQDREWISAWQQDVSGFFHVEFQSQHVATFMPQPGKWSGRSDWNSEACSCRLRKSDAFSNAIPTYPYKSTVPQRVTIRQSVTWCSTEVIFWNAFGIFLVNIAVDEDVRCLQVSWPCQVWFEIVIEDVVFVPCTHKQNEKRQNDTEKNTAEWRDRTLSWASDAAGSVSWKGTKWIFVNSGLEKRRVLHVVQVLFWMPTWHFLVSTSLRHKLCKLFKAPDVLSQSTKTLVRVATS